jgi:DNA-binding winged helix-turn-helix (wHTH) protein
MEEAMIARAEKLMTAELETRSKLLRVLHAIHEAEKDEVLEQVEFKMRLWKNRINSVNRSLPALKINKQT